MKFDYDLGVIGGGAAGLSVTAGAARLGAKVLLIDKSSRLGGDCLHCGCVPSKTLLHVAKIYHQSRNMDALGLPSSPPGVVDFAKVNRHIQSVIRAIEPHDSPERFRRLGAAVLRGCPEFLDNHLIRVNGQSISARNWVLATGSEPAIPVLPGLESVSYLTNKNLFALQELPAHLMILGAGPVALEMAQAFARLGSTVSVLQRGTEVLSREDVDMAGLIRQHLEEEGVRFLLQTRVRQVENRFGQIVLHVDTDDGSAQIVGSHLLVAVGRVANVYGLGLERLGIAVSSDGISVDARLRTVCRNIFAAGDVLGQYQFTHAAGYEAGVVIANTIFRIPRKVDYALLPWCTYTDPELASIGLNEKRALKRGVVCDVRTEELATNDRAVTTGESSGKLKVLLDRRERPVGVQICSACAGEMLGMWIGTMTGKVGISAIAGAVFPYPTFGETNRKIAGSIMGAKLFSPQVRLALRYLFGLRGHGGQFSGQDYDG